MIRVRLSPYWRNGYDGVSRYIRSLAGAFPQDIRLVTDDSYEVLHLVDAHQYDDEWKNAKRNGKKLVVTVHDLIPELYGLSGECYSGVAERAEVFSNADRIIAVSKKTKEDIVKLYRISQDKITVVYNGGGENHGMPEAGRQSLPQNYILWVGRRAGYKHFDWWAKSAAHFIRANKLDVICTGGQQFGRRERLRLMLLGVRSRFHVVDLEDSLMPSIYKSARFLVMPSLYEGFGLPVVEAMANGCPVVLPRDHVFPEIAEDSAAWYKQGNAASLYRAMCDANTAETRKLFVERGADRAKLFSWRMCGAGTAAVYQEIITGQ